MRNVLVEVSIWHLPEHELPPSEGLWGGPRRSLGGGIWGAPGGPRVALGGLLGSLLGSLGGSWGVPRRPWVSLTGPCGGLGGSLGEPWGVPGDTLGSLGGRWVGPGRAPWVYLSVLGTSGNYCKTVCLYCVFSIGQARGAVEGPCWGGSSGSLQGAHQVGGVKVKILVGFVTNRL